MNVSDNKIKVWKEVSLTVSCQCHANVMPVPSQYHASIMYPACQGKGSDSSRLALCARSLCVVRPAVFLSCLFVRISSYMQAHAISHNK